MQSFFRLRTIYILVLVVFSASLLAYEEKDLTSALLSNDYIGSLTVNKDDSPNWKAGWVIANGLSFKETNYRMYESRFIQAMADLNINQVDQGFIYPLKIIETVVSTSMVESLKLLDKMPDTNLNEVLALKLFLIDWQETGDPVSASKFLNLAMKIQENFPMSDLPYLALLTYHSESAFRSIESLKTYREKILENRLENLYAPLISAEYANRLVELVIEDFSRIEKPDDLTSAYVALALFEDGQYERSEEILKSIFLSRLDRKTASKSYDVLGQIAENRKEYDIALEYYRRAIDANSDNSAAISRLGMVYLKSDKKDKENLARFYLEMSKLEEFDPEVKSTLKQLRRSFVLKVLFFQLIPLLAGVVVLLFLVEYFHRKRRKKQETDILNKQK